MMIVLSGTLSLYYTTTERREEPLTEKLESWINGSYRHLMRHAYNSWDQHINEELCVDLHEMF